MISLETLRADAAEADRVLIDPAEVRPILDALLRRLALGEVPATGPVPMLRSNMHEPPFEPPEARGEAPLAAGIPQPVFHADQSDADLVRNLVSPPPVVLHDTPDAEELAERFEERIRSLLLARP